MEDFTPEASKVTTETAKETTENSGFKALSRKAQARKTEPEPVKLEEEEAPRITEVVYPDEPVVEEDKDLPRHRIDYLEANRVHYRSQDPYGFWTINLDRGSVPDSLRGYYTSYAEAVKAFETYQAQKKK